MPAPKGYFEKEFGIDPGKIEPKVTPKHDLDCVFCMRILNNEYTAISRKYNCVVIKPLKPVVIGHILVVPIQHSIDATYDPFGAGMAFTFAAELIQDEGYDANIISSIGPEATQTVFHTHIHVVPRKRGDDLKLPWTEQKKKSKLSWKNGPPSGQEIHIQGGGPNEAAMLENRRRQAFSNVYDDDRINWRG